MTKTITITLSSGPTDVIIDTTTGQCDPPRGARLTEADRDAVFDAARQAGAATPWLPTFTGRGSLPNDPRSPAYIRRATAHLEGQIVAGKALSLEDMPPAPRPRIYLLNTTIITTSGLTYTSRVIGLVEARTLLGLRATDKDRAHDRAAGLTSVDVTRVEPYPQIVSAIGHAATAAIASEILGLEVPVDRTPIRMEDGDLAICVKLRGRAPEGAILSRTEMEAIGWDLVLLTARDPAHLRRHLGLLERALELLSCPDDVMDGEQTPGSRRRGASGMQEDYVIRLPLPEATYVRVTQAWGTEEWKIDDISPEEARAAARPTGVRAAILAALRELVAHAHVLGGQGMIERLAPHIRAVGG